MRDDYLLKGPLKKIEIEVEVSVADALATMEKYSKHTRSEITNTALKRFISGHKDFFPPPAEKTKG